MADASINFMILLGTALKESVTVEIQNRKRGFARDIAREAERDYDGVLVGRKGMSNVKDLVLGSTATKLITGARSRAAAVAQEARDGGFGTIVVGRRGLSSVKDFLMGRVSDKLITLSKSHAVWVVN